MTNYRYVICLILSTIAGCGAVAEESPPGFVSELIDKSSAAPVTNPPTSIWQYRFRDQLVFYVPPSCCDEPSALYDQDGRVICSPDGGLTGKGDGRCPDFFDERTEEKLLWRDKRGSRGNVMPAPAESKETPMKRITGIGGIFFKAKDASALRAWYREHLGIDVKDWGGAVFEWTDSAGRPANGMTTWTISSADSDYYAPSKSPFMINYRVADLHALVATLKSEGCQVLEKIEESEFGKFAWVIDPEGNKIELWEPPSH
ncbi:MAG: VOC family protein [Steroidobacteraceae bacterium]